MKNLLIMIGFLMTICFMSACNHKTESVEDPIIEQIDSIVVDTVVADTVVTDSIL